MATYTVTTLDDETAATTDLATEMADGNGLSLREAIAIANAVAGDDDIIFDGALAGMTLTLTNGALTLDSNIDMDGDTDNDGVADITIDANDLSRIFYHESGTSSLYGLIMTEGNSSSGGAIYLYNGNLTVSNSTISNSYAAGIGGGIVSGFNGYLTVVIPP